MSKPTYSALDAAILEAIKAKQPVMFHRFAYSGEVDVQAKPLAETAGVICEPWRVVDRRLQALRKAGQVRYQRKPEGWVIATPPQQGDSHE